jgi:hypothetical protein
MKVSFNEIIDSKEKMKDFDRTNPYNVSALLVHVLCNYNAGNENNFYDMLQFLEGEYQTISSLDKQNVRDRMFQNNKSTFIGKSYFVGAIPDNDYTPSLPYEVEVVENDYSDVEQGFKRLFLKSGGADSPRPILLRLAKDGNYYIWSNSYIGLLADIKPIESSNPWV